MDLDLVSLIFIRKKYMPPPYLSIVYMSATVCSRNQCSLQQPLLRLSIQLRHFGVGSYLSSRFVLHSMDPMAIVLSISVLNMHNTVPLRTFPQKNSHESQKEAFLFLFCAGSKRLLCAVCCRGGLCSLQSNICFGGKTILFKEKPGGERGALYSTHE